MTTSRLETFADGVFAIAATLLILNVDAQVGSAPPNLGAGLLDMWPSYVAFAVSLLTNGVILGKHHTGMTPVGRADRTVPNRESVLEGKRVNFGGRRVN